MRSLTVWTILTIAFCAGASPQSTLSPEQLGVLKVDEDYRLAKLQKDLPTMDRVLSEDFAETNQNGNTRNKAETLKLWATFGVSELTTDSVQIRISGNSAVISGSMTENLSEEMLFTRVYVRTQNGWQLLSSMQFRDPRIQTAAR